jgi:peptidyl-prolyl cis-trans isomerase SurA
MAWAVARLAVLAVMLGGAAPSSAQSPFEAAAIVNDQIVTRYDIDQRRRLLVLNGAPAAEAESLAANQLVDDALRREAAQRLGISPTDGGVRDAVAEYAAQRNLSPDALNSALQRAGVDPATLEEALRIDIAWREAVRRRFGPRAEPSEAELDQELALAAAGQSRSYRLAEIVLPTAQRGEAETRRQAEQIVAELRAGGDFAGAARRNSASPSAAQGGDIGWLGESGLPSAIADAVAGLNPGQVSDPIPVPNAIVILSVLDRRTEAGGVSAVVELMLMQAGGPDAAARVGAVAAQRPTCETGSDLAQAARLEVQRSEPMEIGALQPRIREAVMGLEVGEVSEVLTAPASAAIVIVCNIATGESPQARDNLRNQVRSQRLTAFANAWIQELRGDAVIERR